MANPLFQQLLTVRTVRKGNAVYNHHWPIRDLEIYYHCQPADAGMTS